MISSINHGALIQVGQVAGSRSDSCVYICGDQIGNPWPGPGCYVQGICVRPPEMVHHVFAYRQDAGCVSGVEERLRVGSCLRGFYVHYTEPRAFQREWIICRKASKMKTCYLLYYLLKFFFFLYHVILLLNFKIILFFRRPSYPNNNIIFYR